LRDVDVASTEVRLDHRRRNGTSPLQRSCDTTAAGSD
jgi:hypothetical protein